MDVENWFLLEDSARLEDQVKFFIASTCEGYLNGCYDCCYEPMTRNEWLDYIWKTIEYDRGTYVNGHEPTHLNFYGKENFMKLTNLFLDNYENVKEWIKEE